MGLALSDSVRNVWCPQSVLGKVKVILGRWGEPGLTTLTSRARYTCQAAFEVLGLVTEKKVSACCLSLPNYSTFLSFGFPPSESARNNSTELTGSLEG